MQITMQSTRLAWPAKTKLRMTPDCSRIAKEIAMMSGLLALRFSRAKFHSPQMKPCKSPDYFIKVSFHIVVVMRQGESNIFQISTWKAFYF